MLWEQSSLLDICDFHHDFDYKHRCLIEENVPRELILPSRWQYSAESLGMETTSCLWFYGASIVSCSVMICSSWAAGDAPLQDSVPLGLSFAIYIFTLIQTALGGSRGLVVMGGDSCSKGHGLNPSAGYWMEMTFFTLICCKNCIVCLKRPKINEKEAGVGPFLKKNPNSLTYY